LLCSPLFFALALHLPTSAPAGNNAELYQAVEERSEEGKAHGAEYPRPIRWLGEGASTAHRS